MTTTLNLPDDLARAVQQRAAEGGHDLAAEVVDLLRKGLAVSERPAAGAPAGSLVVSTDPATGLPVIHSPPDAPIRSMKLEEILALEEEAQLQEDLERAGLPVRH